MMKIKLKKCKGTGKAKDRGCGEQMILKRYGLCSNCFRSWLLSTKEGKEVLSKSTLRAKKVVQIEKKKEAKKVKIENKTIAVLIQEARAPFQKLIRIRDHGKSCICCDKHLPFNIGDYDGGHYYSAEMNSGLIFHPNNVHGQLTYCNKYNHGNESGYNHGIIKRIGLESFEELKKYHGKYKSYKWDRYKLIELKEYYKRELNQVEKGLKDIKEIDLTIGIINI